MSEVIPEQKMIDTGLMNDFDYQRVDDETLS
jgi:hypothetical protein